MIDIANEQLVPIRDVPRLLPRRSTGRRVHISAVYRWIAPGVHGVRLASIKIGGTTYTSAEALQAFAQHLSRADRSGSPSVVRRRQIELAEREAKALLQTPQPKKRSS